MKFERESRIDERLAKMYLSEENHKNIVKRLDKMCELCETTSKIETEKIKGEIVNV